MASRKFLLTIGMAPGDVLLLTALVRDLKTTYGDQYLVDVRTKFPAIWRHNPHLTPLRDDDKAVERIKMTYDITRPGREVVHFLRDYYRVFEERTKIRVPCLKPHADLHFSEKELVQNYIEKPYWIIIPGGKTDITIKFWDQLKYQEVADRLVLAGLPLIQEGAVKKLHIHPPLDNVLNIVGMTSIRDLIINVLHAEGVVCGVTFPMHIAGALHKPCVVVAGAREEPWWEDYSNDWPGSFGDKAEPVKVPHRLLHTLGQLPCCRAKGCWRQRTHKLHDRDKNDNNLCERPKPKPSGQTVAECYDMITADHVVDSVFSYYYDGTLRPPIRTPLAEDVEKIVKNPVTGEFSFTRHDGATVTISTKQSDGTAAKFVNINDIVPERTPALLKETEHMQTGQSRPEKGQVHVAPGMAPKKPAVKTAPAPPAPADGRLGIMDDPRIGGKITICALLYGEGGTKYHELHRRCLNSIVQTVPPSRMDLRVGCNEVPLDTINYLKTLPITKQYVHAKQLYKYPMMHKMFHDPNRPITTDWVIWFDDDSYARQPDWLIATVNAILNQDPKMNVGMFGQKMYHRLQTRPGKDPLQWFKNGKWFRGKNFQNARGREVPNGNAIHFVTGGFWCISREAIERCQIPDTRLKHNGGDICIGCQVAQNGYKIMEFNTNKTHCHTSAAPRRGFHEKFPWYR